MKQPDTAALRERLANYTPEDKLEQDKQELDGLLQEVNCQLIEFRKLLKGINAQPGISRPKKNCWRSTETK